MSAENIYNKLQATIGNHIGTSALMGNLHAESGVRSDRLEDLCRKRLREAGKGDYTDSLYTQEVDSGKISLADFLNPLPGKQYGYGLAQWTSPKRKKKLYEFAKSRGVSIGDEDMQVDFLISELTTDFPSVFSALCNARTIRGASDIVLKKFEAPADASPKIRDKREALGIEYYKRFSREEARSEEMNNVYARGKKLLCGGYSEYTPSGKAFFVRMNRYSKVPQAGSVMYFYYKNKGRVAHVEIVTSVRKTGERYNITTVGGNTSGSSVTRNGGEVARHEFSFTLDQVGNENKIDGFGHPIFGENTCGLEDFLTIVNAEVGYLEKASKKDLQSKTGNAGFANFTKYGEWYNDNGVYWCQQFVSWCAYESCRVYLENRKTMWVREGSDWKYLLRGEYVKGKWMHIGGRWYVFDNAGNAIAGWFESGGDWYYLNPADNAMLSGQWIEDKGNSYYLTKTGVMARSAYIKFQTENKYYWVNEKGEYDSKWDSLNPDLVKHDLVK